MPLPENYMQMTAEQLATLIEYHNERYWVHGAPEISDNDYDLLTRRLEEVAPDHPLLKTVHAPIVAGSGKIRHRNPMLSLDKAYSLAELVSWAAKYVRNSDELFIVQPKYDGISANFTGGILSTRGDGYEGENISDKIPLIELETAGYRGPLNRDARGEIIIRDDDFKNIYSKVVNKSGKTYKNSRNAVAGIMGLKDISEMLVQHAKLTLADYSLFTQTMKLDELKANWENIVREIEEMPYPTDGIVIKLADEEYSASLGNTAHHPRGQIAFKFSGIRKETKIIGVEWSFGKNCLTPVAQLEPVDIGGITIKNATLHNYQNVIDKDIHINDIATVERAGDVIPYIVSASPGENRINCLISKCPSCSSELKIDLPELRCINPDCPGTSLQRLLAAVRNIGIERLGEPNIKKMMSVLNVKTLKDIFNLKVQDILKLEGFQAKSATNLYKEIQAARDVSDYQILASLNIQGIGPNIAKAILTEYSLDELRKLDKEKLSEINGIGPERAGAIERELTTQSQFLDELISCINMKQTKGNTQSGMATICFTGKMPEQRSYYEKLALQHGYQATDSVTKTLSVLVAADPSENGSKLNNARKHNVKIMSLEEWLDSLKNSPLPVLNKATEEPEKTAVQVHDGPEQLTLGF